MNEERYLRPLKFDRNRKIFEKFSFNQMLS